MSYYFKCDVSETLTVFLRKHFIEKPGAKRNILMWEDDASALVLARVTIDRKWCFLEYYYIFILVEMKSVYNTQKVKQGYV